MDIDIDSGYIGLSVRQQRWFIFIPIFQGQSVLSHLNIAIESFFVLVLFATYIIHHPVDLANLILNIFHRFLALINLVFLKFFQSFMLAMMRDNSLMIEIFDYFVALFYD